ncbi:hypothetical protein APQ14_18655 [Vibrio toranzoniae]|uniref:MFS transporter n=1 Tax=Vibrio toranzoniae TaxID=1194427 RepID=A0A109DC72_9VIBR|nr:hypothetical protein APQ14_18655 [Vibrio toranzoniae]
MKINNGSSLFGLANCSTFITALSFVDLRTSNSSQAASLVDKLHAQTDSWSVPILLIASLAFACTIFTVLAARDKKVSV